VSRLNRRERADKIETLLEAERQRSGLTAEVGESIAERVKVTLGDEIAKAQLLERRSAHPSHPRLRLVPKVVKPMFSSLLAYAPIALAGLGAVSVASAVVYASLPRQMQERVRRLLRLPESNFDGHRAGSLGPVGLGQVKPLPNPTPDTVPVAPLNPPTSVASQLSASPAGSSGVAGVATHRAVARREHVPVRPIPVRPEPVEGRPRATPGPVPDLSLAEESTLLEHARADVLHGSGPQALQALADHERRFPSSRMFEQREALTIQALVKTGRRDEAYWRARRFRNLFPESLMLQVIQPALDHEEP
jgi:hypothetical protein